MMVYTLCQIPAKATGRRFSVDRQGNYNVELRADARMMRRLTIYRMTPAQEQIRDRQKAAWNEFSPGWRKWDAFNMAFLRPMGEQIISELRLKPRDAVLDVATGTGEPGLSIAAALPDGRVVGTDLAEGMLAIAKGRASERGLSNYETRTADVSALPFPDATFDAVSCRMGFMFFPDLMIGAREMVRVLKPGGHLAASVWDAGSLNPWNSLMMGVIQRHVALPPPSPETPGMFRCAPPGLLAGVLRDVGLVNVTERLVSGQVTYDDTAHYWTMMTEVAAPVVGALRQASVAVQAKIKEEVFALLRREGGPLTLDYSARIVAGQK
jgi:ubiquinone/menaquinone biosynthesis C-methylase UbiE